MNVFTRIFFAAAVFALGACVAASGTNFNDADQASIAIKPGKGQVILYRVVDEKGKVGDGALTLLTNPYGAASAPKVNINGASANAKCQLNAAYVLNLPAGSHEFSFARGDATHRVTIRAGERIYLSCPSRTGAVESYFTWKPVSPAIARQELGQTRIQGIYDIN